MKLSRNWLSEFTEVNVSDKEFCDRMTMSGSKVEGVEVLGSEITNVVVGRVLKTERHPDSDHLWVCQVDVGRDAPVQIVTGAQNVREGDLAPVALHKSTLPGGVKIEKGKLRGVLSEGMLCSLGELGLTVNDYPYAVADGIFILQEPCKPGDDIRDVVGLRDSVVDFEITNNRPDCLSVRGLAREAAVTFGTELKLPEPRVKGSGDSIRNYLDVEIASPELCSRYTARFIKNVKIAPSPEWLRRRLRASGIRPISNIVDITNYVMLEYGQPMHSFDYRCIDGSRIVVRTAAEGEEMATLDGSPRALTPDMLVIADAVKPIGLAGIMGGQNSEITGDTTSVVFESANFSGPSIRHTAISLGMRTDASARFEKGLDPLGTLPAVERACELVELLGAGEVVDGVIDVIARDIEPVKLRLEPEKIDRLLGVHTEPAFMKKVLTDLGFTFEGDEMTVPSWRGDVSHYSDIAEEVARFYGYDVIPATAFKGTTAQGGLTEKQQAERDARRLCRDMGYSETLTYSFMGQGDYDLAGMPKDHPLRDSFAILNPLGEDTGIMRTTLLPSILKCMSLNAARRNRDVKLFDLSKVYLKEPGQVLAREEKHLSLGVCGDGADFYTLKGCVEALLGLLRVKDVRYEANTGHFSFHPGRCADVVAADGTVLGTFGELHPNVRKACGISGPAAAAELNFDLLFDRRSPEPQYQPLPRFPAVLRDLALVCSDELTVHELSRCIREAGGALLQEVSFFDVYRGAPIPAGKKSVAFSLSFRKEDGSLTDGEIEPLMSGILKALEEKLGAKLR
ncbi:MAG: phenylalanine--tRNA ligase subunit beta [Oscillospiraceae bacterium]|nr:phenylalanine--tRNA ligase subunit beta [Oscillospiraceae bacterium]